jgi:hypothetical protein
MREGGIIKGTFEFEVSFQARKWQANSSIYLRDGEFFVTFVSGD